MARDKTRAKATWKAWYEKNREHRRNYQRSRRPIVNARKKERLQNDPEYRERRNREWKDWAERNREALLTACRARSAQHRLRTNFGMTLEEFTQLAKRQGFRCAICLKEEITLQKRYDGMRRVRTLSVDHDHRTGKRRGLLCRQCNAGLGHFNDNLLVLKRAIRYLQFFQMNSHHNLSDAQGLLFAQHIS